jgi:hypothetical protein
MEGSGIAAFLLLICSHLQAWDLEWNQCLDDINSMLKVKVSGLLVFANSGITGRSTEVIWQIDVVLDPEKLRNLIFDDSFEISENYFTILQILRIFAGYIQESMDHLRAMQSEFLSWHPTGSLSHSYRLSLAARRVLAQNWQTVVDLQSEIGKRLLARIDRKTEEVKSLRDGVRRASYAT